MNESTTAGRAREKGDAISRVAFDLTPALSDEIDRILAMTDLGSKPEVFRRAFTLLRIHVDAAVRGRQVYMVDPDRPNEKFIITLPFTVRSNSPVAE